MTKTVFEKNIEQIAIYDKNFAERISRHDISGCSFEFFETRAGDYNLKYNEIMLHDEIDPENEALEIYNKLPYQGKADIHVIYGLGLGYLFKRFSLNAKGKIILFEPNLDILRITLDVVDFSEELSRNNIRITDNIDGINTYIQSFFTIYSNLTFSYLKSYEKFDGEKIRSYAEEINILKTIVANNYKNIMENSAAWARIGILNLGNLSKNYDFELLRNKFIDKPAVILSAGPSLSKNIDLLKNYEDNAIIFCVGSAYKAALNHGIKPDFLVMVDSNDISAQIKGADNTDVNVILTPSTNYKIFETAFKRKFNYYSVNDYTTRWLDDFIGFDLSDYCEKGTVSITCIYAAKILGCNPIILIGQDLAYTGGRCYVEGSGQPEIVVQQSAEGVVVDTQNVNEYIKQNYTEEQFNRWKELHKKRIDNANKNICYVKGINGEMLPTDPAYAGFVKYFEQIARDFNDKKLINSTLEGAFLQGFDHIAFDKALKNYAAEYISKDEIIENSLQGDKGNFEEKKKYLLKKIQDAIIDLNKINIICEEEKELVKKLKSNFENNFENQLELKQNIEDILLKFKDYENIVQNNLLLFALLADKYINFSHFIQSKEIKFEADYLKIFDNVFDLSKNLIKIFLNAEEKLK